MVFDKYGPKQVEKSYKDKSNKLVGPEEKDLKIRLWVKIIFYISLIAILFLLAWYFGELHD